MRAKFAAVGVPGPAEEAVSVGATRFRPCCRLAVVTVSAILTALGAGCADIRPTAPESEGHIAAASKPKPEVEKAIPPPARVSTFVPPPKPAPKPQTYSVVVNEVPVKELLLALTRDTKQNIDIHPGLQGVVSLNAINETLPAILDRIARQVNMRFRLEGNAIVVGPDTPYLKTYRVGYVNMTRDTTSTIAVSGEITGSSGASGGGTGAAGASGSAGGGAGGSSTVVRTVSNNNFWEQLRDNIRAILASTRARSLSADEKAAVDEERRKAADTALKQAEVVARAGQGATPLFTAAFRGAAAQPQLLDVRDDIIVNQVTGTVSVLATERQHQLVQQHLDSISTASQRQVLIEATIVEIQLSQAYQAGVDWNRISTSGGIAFAQKLLGNNLATEPFFALFYNQNNLRENHISLTIKLLEQFGQTRVLSSPKLMALNNQTALLKVVDNIVYFDVQAQISQAVNAPTLTSATTTARTVAVGVVMGVTPQINDDGRVSVAVRPTISRVVRFVDDPNPSLAIVGVRNRVPEIQTREMESVLQVGSGQTVILGGLMQNETRRSRDQVPLIGSQPQVGDLFAFRDESASKTELVIFLRTTVIPNPSLESDELKFFQRFLPQAETPQENPRPAR